jgi:Na+/H+ antiporter NhaC
MCKVVPLFFILILSLAPRGFTSNPQPYNVKLPRIMLSNVTAKITIYPTQDFLLENAAKKVRVSIQEIETQRFLFTDSLRIDIHRTKVIEIPDMIISQAGKRKLLIQLGSSSQEHSIRVLPAFLSILPPLLAILLALLTRQVIVALFFGIWLGVAFIYDFSPFLGFLHTLDEYIVNALADRERISILVFSLVLGGMVGVISRSGGTQGIVDKLSSYAKNARLGQLATWGMGVLIFFDDYANTLIVGNTMRPLTDRLRISREKLSYLVDSTAAPVANIAIISTWIGYEISLIKQSFESLGVSENAYITFLKTIPYNFYPVYTLFFGFMIAFLMRDFGSMYQAEMRARKKGETLRADAIPLSDLTDADYRDDVSIPKRWTNAFIPIGVVILSVILGLVYTGITELGKNGMSLTDQGFIQQVSLIVGMADSFAVLMWASFLGSITAILLAISQHILSLQQAIDAWVKGIRSMIMAAIILTSAWAIGMICQDLYTADYVIHLTRNFLTPYWLPLVTFLTAAVVSFSTGTSWGTMAILMPIAIPFAVKFPSGTPGIESAHATALMLSTTAAVLAGATFGDHCSPISDTTIMSSMASGADHIDHVRTQLPYAISAGFIACLFGYLPVGFGIGNWWVLPFGFITLFLIVRFIGKRTD